MKRNLGQERQTYLCIGLDRAQRYIGSPIVVLSPPIHRPIPFHAYSVRLVGQERDLVRLVIVADYVLLEFPTFEQLLFRLLYGKKREKKEIKFELV